MSSKKSAMREVRWHGRGGQGAVTSSKLLADAAFRSGFAGVTGAPSFGAERRGAPVTASTRMSAAPIRVWSQVTQPDIVIVLDESLLDVANATAGLKPGGMLIVNTSLTPEELGIDGDVRVVVSDVSGAAREIGLIVAGQPMVSAAILGAVARATGLISMESVAAAIKAAFGGSAADKNLKAAQLAYERTRG